MGQFCLWASWGILQNFSNVSGMIRFLFFVIVLIPASCSTDSELSDQSCQEAFLYPMSDETISLTPVTGVVMLEFLDSENIETLIQSLFATYEFLDEEFFPV